MQLAPAVFYDLNLRLLLRLLVFCVVGSSTLHSSAQTAFERAVDYAYQIDELNQQFSMDQETQQAILNQARQQTQALREAWRDLYQIQAAGVQQDFLVALKSLEQDLLNFQSLAPTRKTVEQAYILSTSRTRNSSELIVALSQLSQLRFAKETTNGRLRKLIAEINRLGRELVENSKKQLQSFAQYRDLADVYGMRTRLELQAALREVSSPDPSNVGARYLRAVTLRRLGRFEEAEQELVELAQREGPLQPLMVAARAENLQQLGRTREAKRLYGNLNTDSRDGLEVNGYQGLFMALTEDWRNAVRFWELGLHNGEQEVALRRNLAIVLATRRSDHPVARREAIEHAELASKLSSENEWSVELARALALHVNGRKEEALDALELAQELTSGECLAFCTDIFRSLQDGRQPIWDFVRH